MTESTTALRTADVPRAGFAEIVSRGLRTLGLIAAGLRSARVRRLATIKQNKEIVHGTPEDASAAPRHGSLTTLCLPLLLPAEVTYEDSYLCWLCHKIM